MKYIITESKLKSLIKSQFGVDLTDRIHMVTNKWELPFEFEFVSPRALNTYLNKFGPMYVFELGKRLYLAQNQGREDGWMIVDTGDRVVTELEFMKLLGIESLGLSMDDLLNQYFDEKTLYEQVTDEYDDSMGKIIQSYLNKNIPNYYGIKRFWVDYNEHFDRYEINIFFDRQIAIDMGGGINMLIRNAINSIGQEIDGMFSGVRFAIFQHFED